MILVKKKILVGVYMQQYCFNFLKLFIYFKLNLLKYFMYLKYIFDIFVIYKGDNEKFCRELELEVRVVR